MQEDELYLFTKEVIGSFFGRKESIANIEISEAYSLIPGDDKISAKARRFFMIEVNEEKRVIDSAMMGDHNLSKEEYVEIRKKIDLAKEKHKTGDYEASDELKCIEEMIVTNAEIIKKRNIEWDRNNGLNPPVKLGENRISPNWCVHCGAATYSIDTNTSDCDCRFQRYNPDINKLHVCNVCANYHINGKQSGFARTYNLFYGGRCPGEFLFCNNTL